MCSINFISLPIYSFIWFKIDESEFYGSNKFSISQALFGKNGKYKLSYKSDIKYEK